MIRVLRCGMPQYRWPSARLFSALRMLHWLKRRRSERFSCQSGGHNMGVRDHRGTAASVRWQNYFSFSEFVKSFGLFRAGLSRDL